jgi:hypothetical protein
VCWVRRIRLMLTADTQQSQSSSWSSIITTIKSNFPLFDTIANIINLE